MKPPSIWRAVFQPKMLIVFLLGFSSGLPLLLIGGTLKAWLRQSQIDLSTIGFFSLVGLPYTLKFLWAPLLDRFLIGKLGRRRGWILVSQVALALGFFVLGGTDPTVGLQRIAVIAVVIAFFSSTQDIVIDAYRREVLRDEELGLGSSLGINGYRLAMYASGALALVMAGLWSWQITYWVMAATMAACVLITAFAPEPETKNLPRTLKEAVVGPFVEYFKRPGALWILAFVLLYKIGDSMAGEMLNPLYIDLGFTLEQIGVIAKTLGIIGVLAGSAIGGLIILRLGVTPSLWFFGILQALSTAGFAGLANFGQGSVVILAIVIGFENLTSGMGTAAYVGFMASVTDRRFTATQYALLSSLTGIPRVIFGASTGVLANSLGWSGFFWFCTLIAVPGLFLIPKIKGLRVSSSISE